MSGPSIAFRIYVKGEFFAALSAVAWLTLLSVYQSGELEGLLVRNNIISPVLEGPFLMSEVLTRFRCRHSPTTLNFPYLDSAQCYPMLLSGRLRARYSQESIIGKHLST